MYKLSISIMRVLGFFAVLNAIILDFYHHLEWVDGYVQYGPMVLFILYILAGAFIASKLYEGREEPEGRNLSPFIYPMMITMFLTVIFAMNIFVGEPNSDIFDISAFEFWFVVVALPIISKIKSCKKSPCRNMEESRS